MYGYRANIMIVFNGVPQYSPANHTKFWKYLNAKLSGNNQKSDRIS